MIKLLTLSLLTTFLLGCKYKSTESASKSAPTIRKLLPDTTVSWLAKQEFDSYISRNNLGKKLGLSDIENSNDSLEIRVWLQASIYSPSSVWVIHYKGDSSTAMRLDYFPRYDGKQGIDSIHTFNLKPTVATWKEYSAAINLQSFWKLPFHYELERSERQGCVDGESVTIEMFDKYRLKSVMYSCYSLYRDSSTYKDFTNLLDRIRALKR